MRKRNLFMLFTVSAMLFCALTTDAQIPASTLSVQEEKRAAIKKLNAEAMGLFLQATGDSLRAAREKLITVQNFYLEIGEKRLAASTLIMTGRIYMQLGEYPNALKYLEQSAALWQEIGDQKWEAMTLIPLGAAYGSLGKDEKELEINERILQLSRAAGNKIGEAQALETIGTKYLDRLEFLKSLEYYRQALLIYREVGAGQSEVGSLGRIGWAHFRSGNQIKALETMQEALALSRSLKDVVTERSLLNSIGAVYLKAGEKTKALENFQQSLVLYRTGGSIHGEAAILSNLQNYWRLDNNPRLAIFYGKQAVNKYQKLRQSIQTLDKETQKTFLKTIQSTYQKLVGILIAQGRIAEAEQVLAMLKEEEYFDYLRRDDKLTDELKEKISLTPAETEAFKRYEEIANEITRIGKEFGELERESKKFPIGKFPRQTELDRLDANLADARKVFNKFLAELDAKFRNQETKQQDARVAEISGTKALLDSLSQPRTVIISTIAGEDRLNLIVTTSKINRAHTVEVKAADLNKLVADFRGAVKNPTVDPRPLGKKLFDILFPADLQKDLAGVEADTIVWSLDGTLRYAPIAALWDGEKYLAERYANAVITLASRDKIDKIPATRKNWTALGVGVSKEFENFPALAAVPEELCRVVNDPQKRAACLKLTGGKAGVLGGVNLSDDEFTFQAFKLYLGRYPIVHIASHFSLNAGTESDSYLLLGGGKTGDERKLTLASVRENLDTKFVGTELLVLSACNTAMLAGEQSSGAEIEGFGALAQQQGAKTVLASLWSVADASTRDLMSGFYQILETDLKISKAEALRQAQIKLINGKFKTEQVIEKHRSDAVRFGAGANDFPKFIKDANAPFAHPFYWSPFVLIGNWR